MVWPPKLKVHLPLLLALVLLSAPGSGATEAAEPRPLLQIPSPHYVAGSHWQGEVVVHTFRVINAGDAELRLLKVRPG